MIESLHFQTPPIVCDFMASKVLPLIPFAGSVLEPTPGIGNLVAALERSHMKVTTPDGDFWPFFEFDAGKFDAVVMNPPFTPATEGYMFLDAAISLSDVIVALMPWVTLTNSDSRTKRLFNFGMKEVITLPRKTFPGSRVNSCVLILKKGFKGPTAFNYFTW